MSQLAFDDVLAFVRSYSNGVDEPSPFDVNGVIHLMLAALDNFREHLIDGDWDQLAETVTNEQKAMLIRVGDFLRQRQPA